MKLLFKNKTKYTPDTYQEYLSFHQKVYGLSHKFYTAIVLFSLLFCIIAQVSFHYYTLAIIVSFALTGFILWRLFHPIYVISKELNSDTLQEQKEFVFKFYEKYFRIYYHRTFDNIHYKKLYKIFETNTFFYLYIDKNHALLLAKSNFSIGTSEDFATFLKRKKPFKYHKKLSFNDDKIREKKQ